MKNVWKWILIALGIALVVFLIAFPLLRMGTAAGYAGVRPFGGHFMMRSGGLMMAGLGFLLLKGVFFLAVLGFAVYGVVALATRGKKPAMPPPAPLTCNHCGKIVQPDWMTCPYCGNALKDDAKEKPQE